MTTTFVWTVTSMSTLPSPTPDYVVNVQYRVTGTDTSTPPNAASIQGSSTFPVSTTQTTFVPYASLTQAEVLGWIQAEPNVTVNTEACVQGMINSMVNPPVSPSNTPLPWVTMSAN